MKSVIYLFIFALMIPLAATAQFSQAARDSINKLSAEDHAHMMKQLDLNELQPGPSGNPEAPNAANADEDKVRDYKLPELLSFENGEEVTDADDWKRRKAELKELFNKEIYGLIPDDVPGVEWELIQKQDTVEGEFPVIKKSLAGHVDNSMYPEIEVSIDLTVTIPAEAEKPVPLVIHYGWNWPEGFSPPSEGDGPSWEEQLLEKGWGYAVLVPTSYQADNGAGLTQGIIGLTNKGERRTPGEWGTLRAWGWGASRTIDYLETDSDIDHSRIGIEGLSRYGKAALVTMAYEPRISVGFIGSSGAGGAKILRRNFGEQIENLASSAEYHWFAGNFIKYAGPLTADDLPVDAHQLIALCAPRPVFISVGAPDVEGTWVDAKGMFLAAKHASPAYELLGANGLGVEEMPQLGTNVVDGDVAFRQHEGGHTTGPNWPYFIDFASRYFD